MSEEQPEPLTEEPKRMNALVRDGDGHMWRRGRTRWTCQAKIGTRYFSSKTRRLETVESIGRLPWSTLKSWYGPLTLVDDGTTKR